MKPTVSFYMLIMAVACVGAADGLLLALLFRARLLKVFLSAAAGAALAYASEEMYSYFRLAYADCGAAETVLAYAACGAIVALLLAAPVLFLAAAGSFLPGARRAAQRLGAAWALLSLGIGMYGVSFGAWEEDVHIIPVAAEISAGWDGARIAQITDTHIGPYCRIEDLERDLATAEEAGADLAVITGDLIDDNSRMPRVSEILSAHRGKFPLGMVYIWGNHEYYHEMSEVREGLAAAGVPILENENVPLFRGGDALYFAGVDYPWARGEAHLREVFEMAEAAFRGIPENAPVILLAHHPDFLDEGFSRGAFLTMAGHTHGMQFGMFGRPVITPYKYTRGAYTDGTHAGYVSRGNGGWFPFRFGASRELVIYELHRR